MGLLDGEEHAREDAQADRIDMVGDDEAPDGVEQIDPLKGLLDPENGVNSPVADTGSPVPPG